MKKRTRHSSEAVKKIKPTKRPFDAPVQSIVSWRDLLFHIDSSSSFGIFSSVW